MQHFFPKMDATLQHHHVTTNYGTSIVPACCLVIFSFVSAGLCVPVLALALNGDNNLTGLMCDMPTWEQSTAVSSVPECLLFARGTIVAKMLITGLLIFAILHSLSSRAGRSRLESTLTLVFLGGSHIYPYTFTTRFTSLNLRRVVRYSISIMLSYGSIGFARINSQIVVVQGTLSSEPGGQLLLTLQLTVSSCSSTRLLRQIP